MTARFWNSSVGNGVRRAFARVAADKDRKGSVRTIITGGGTRDTVKTIDYARTSVKILEKNWTERLKMRGVHVYARLPLIREYLGSP